MEVTERAKNLVQEIRESNKYVGIRRKVDDLGRIVIPKELRKQAEIHKDDYIDIIPMQDGEAYYFVLRITK